MLECSRYHKKYLLHSNILNYYTTMSRCKDYLIAFGVWLRLWRAAGMPIHYVDTKLREAENYSRLLYSNLSLEEWRSVRFTLDKCPKDNQGVIL